MTRYRRHALAVAAVSLAARLGVVLWAAGRIPPAADGTYYDTLARRLAAGHGYTWLWPDGAVTYAAHYPVGYPALLALGYAAFGAKPVVAMLLNAALGALASVATWSLVARASSPRLALLAGVVSALHPALLPYTAAIMTEGVTASLLVIAAALTDEARASSSPVRWLALTGLVMGIATLVRPQALALAPVFGAVALIRRPKLALVGAAAVTAIALVVCAPWTARNCVRMERCALVSVNGGWNLAIGAQTKSGAWQEIAVPEACREVFQEAAKDSCFGREATRTIVAAPGAWLARVPAKLRATFDYFGAAPWYLHTANPTAFPWGAKVALGTVETLASRLLLAAALVTLYRGGTRVRKAVVLLGLASCALVPGTVAYLALAVAIALVGWPALQTGPTLMPVTAVVVLSTAATHAVFFGAGRYGLVVVPFVTALGFVRRSSALALPAPGSHAADVDAVQAIAGSRSREREESPSSTEHDAG